MPLAEAAYGISLAEHHVSNMLADGAGFQAFCSVADDMRARQRVFFDSLPPPDGDRSEYTRDELKAFRPLAIVFTLPENGFKRERGATETYVESGVIGIHLEQNVPDNLAGDQQQLMRQFKNAIGRIVSDLCEQAYLPTYLAVNSIEVAVLAREAEDAVPQHGDNLFAFLVLRWGADG